MFDCKKLSIGLLFLAAISFQTAAIADQYGDDSDKSAQNDQASDASVYSGGIGDDEISYIKQVQHNYDAKILFTHANGMYLSDLNVTIADRQGNSVVSTVTQGPVLLVKLPTGNYKVTATQGNQSHSQNISVVSHKLTSYQIRFSGSDSGNSGD